MRGSLALLPAAGSLAILIVVGAQLQDAALSGASAGTADAVMVEVYPESPQRIPESAIEELRRTPGVRAVAPVRMYNERVVNLDPAGREKGGPGGSVYALAPPPELFRVQLGTLPRPDEMGVVLTASAVRSLGWTAEEAIGKRIFYEVRLTADARMHRIGVQVAGVIGDGVIRGIAIITPAVADAAEAALARNGISSRGGFSAAWVYATDQSSLAATAQRLGLFTLGRMFGTR